eukprot:gene9192-biopygen3697
MVSRGGSPQHPLRVRRTRSTRSSAGRRQDIVGYPRHNFQPTARIDRIPEQGRRKARCGFRAHDGVVKFARIASRSDC